MPAGELFAFGAVLSLQIGSLFNQLGAQSFTGAVAVLGDRAAGGTGGHGDDHRRRRQRGRRAVAAVPDVLSYDYRSLGATPDRARPHLTPEFARQYQQTFQATVIPMATANRAVTKALVRGAGLIDSSADQARCLVFVDQLLVSAAPAPAPKSPPAESLSPGTSVPTKVTQNRVMVTLTRRGDTWLVADLTPF